MRNPAYALYDVTPDDQRFVLLRIGDRDPTPRPPNSSVVVNWFGDVEGAGGELASAMRSLDVRLASRHFQEITSLRILTPSTRRDVQTRRPKETAWSAGDCLRLSAEPITSEAWQPVPERSVLAIDADIGVLLASI